MKLPLSVLALAVAMAMPLTACAQVNAQSGGPSPEFRAKMEQVRSDSKTAAFNDLSPDHRAKVQAIVDQINAGKLTDIRGAVQQVDAILTPDESKAVLAERDKMMTAMHAAMQSEGAPAPAASGQGEHRGGPGGGMMRGKPDAGRVLLQLSVSRETMRALRSKQQGQPQNPTPQ
jgi:hypothetical protein